MNMYMILISNSLILSLDHAFRFFLDFFLIMLNIFVIVYMYNM